MCFLIWILKVLAFEGDPTRRKFLYSPISTFRIERTDASIGRGTCRCDSPHWCLNTSALDWPATTRTSTFASTVWVYTSSSSFSYSSSYCYDCHSSSSSASSSSSSWFSCYYYSSCSPSFLFFFRHHIHHDHAPFITPIARHETVRQSKHTDSRRKGPHQALNTEPHESIRNFRKRFKASLPGCWHFERRRGLLKSNEMNG